MKKCKKTHKKPHFGNIGASNMKLYLVYLKFESQVHMDSSKWFNFQNWKEWK
jgi:hypothetical protein